MAVDPNTPDGRRLMDGLQGNILKSHGRDHVAIFLIRLPAAPSELAAVREWIRRLELTSAGKQWDEALTYRLTRDAGRVFRSFAISANGYRRLGYSEYSMPRDVAFRLGMKDAARTLGDPAPSSWQSPYSNAIDALLIVAHDDPVMLDDVVHQTAGTLASVASTRVVVGIERGSILRDERRQSIEPFGYVDGISQPLFLQPDIDEYQLTASVERWNPAAEPFQLVLADDPQTAGKFGSYLVYRKLRQDLRAFADALQRLTNATGLDASDAAGLVVGRRRDGTAVAARAAPLTNDFDYADDQDGRRCPLAAHVRRLNPRAGDIQERGRLIARRGIPYAEATGEERTAGLLFMCYQQDISRQFEFLQRHWANALLDATGRHIGQDPLIGQASESPWPQAWPTMSGGTVRLDLSGFVRLAGGEYFFAPSVDSLRNI
jgi:Dyp-type peroxidase family